MKTNQITHADGLTVHAKGCDHEAAQENAIDELETADVVHSAIVSIRVAA